MSLELAEITRRLSNLLRTGTISEADYTVARVRVESGGLHTDWLPWLTQRAGTDADWWAPEIGEQVLILAPGGELGSAVVLPGLYSDNHPAPASDPDLRIAKFADGAEASYHRKTGTLTVKTLGNAVIQVGGDATAEVSGKATIKTSGDISVEAGGKARIKTGGDAMVEAGGKATIKASAIDLNTGTMKGVVTGECVCAFTGAPHSMVSTTVKAGI